MKSRLLNKKASGQLKLSLPMDSFIKDIKLTINGLISDGGDSLIQYKSTPLTSQQTQFIQELSPAQKGIIDKLNSNHHLEINVDTKGNLSVQIIPSKD